MEDTKKAEKQSFLKNHSDTLTIIGVNIATVAILITMWISHAHRMDCANQRIDTLHTMFYDLLKEGRK